MTGSDTKHAVQRRESVPGCLHKTGVRAGMNAEVEWATACATRAARRRLGSPAPTMPVTSPPGECDFVANGLSARLVLVHTLAGEHRLRCDAHPRGKRGRSDQEAARTYVGAAGEGLIGF